MHSLIRCGAGTLILALASQLTAQTVVQFTADGDTRDELFGTSVSCAGDVNADGYADVIVGAPEDDTNGRDSGQIRVLSGLDGSTLFTITGVGGSLFGASVAAAGDVNGDGVDDFVVGAPKSDLGGSDAGTAFVYSGMDASTLYTFNGANNGDRFGTSVAGAGDVNGDGFDDVIVGAPKNDDNGGDSGHARVLSGFDGSVLHTFVGVRGGDQFGTSVSGAGDVNRDGLDDLIVGAPKNDDNGGDSGHAIVFSGADGTTLHVLLGADRGNRAGTSVSDAGDVDRDGYCDVIVGEPESDINGGKSGLAHVFSGFDGSVLYAFAGDRDSRLGTAVARAGDLNGDGHPDLVVGAPFADTSVDDQTGSVRIYSGIDGSLLDTIDGEAKDDRFGQAVASAGDVDRDGFADVLIGAPRKDTFDDKAGRVYVFDLGVTGVIARQTTFGSPCAGTGGRLPRIGYRGDATIGTTLRITLRGGAVSSPGATIAFGTPGPAPVPLALIGLTGCSLYLQPWFLAPIGTDGFGSAAVDLAFPYDLDTLGLMFDAQWLVPDPGAPYSLPLTLSDALRVTLGGPFT